MALGWEDYKAQQKASGWKRRLKKKEPSELPMWVKIALIRVRFGQERFVDVAKELGRSEDSLRQYFRSQAARKYVETLRSMEGDPLLQFRAAVLDGTWLAGEHLLLYEAAKKIGDLELARKLLNDMKDYGGFVAQRAPQQPQEVVVRIEGVLPAKEVAPAESTYQLLVGPVVDAEVDE